MQWARLETNMDEDHDGLRQRVERLEAKLREERQRLDWILKDGFQVVGLAVDDKPFWIHTREELDAARTGRHPDYVANRRGLDR